MALVTRGKYEYGSGPEDIHLVVARYSVENGYPAEHFADSVCECGGRAFQLALDDGAGVAARTCVECKATLILGDGDEYVEEAELQDRVCPCRSDTFEVAVGVAPYAGSDDVRWLYVGCRCTACNLTAVYGDWKNEFIGYHALLAAM
ncbi:MAG: hypothetical protein H8F28_02350 [Fibrella sp.]|nr:hypothetical protein [Armatimonadota bacterium]